MGGEERDLMNSEAAIQGQLIQMNAKRNRLIDKENQVFGIMPEEFDIVYHQENYNLESQGPDADPAH
jgi:hypothetical protein